MKFKTELHLHSAPVSNCARADAEKIVERYTAAGYTTVVLTNHMSIYTYTNGRFDHSASSWEEKVDYYLSGYEELKKAADGKLNVLLGMELRSNCDDNDYLVYGTTEEMLRALPEMMDMPLQILISKFHEYGCLFFQAHPFRNSMKITRPSLLDGIEIFNGHLDHDSRNDIAELWAKKFGLLTSSGSDFHYPDQDICAGIITDEPITSNEQLLKILKSQSFEMIKK